jgi:hypothetical protein
MALSGLLRPTFVAIAAARGGSPAKVPESERGGYRQDDRRPVGEIRLPA